MEVADLFVINKADRVGAGETRRDLESMLALAPRQGWRPPIVETVATDGRGTADLADALDRHRVWLADTGEGESRRRRRLTDELAAVVTAELARRAELQMAGPAWEEALADVQQGRCDPWAAAARLLGD